MIPFGCVAAGAAASEAPDATALFPVSSTTPVLKRPVGRALELFNRLRELTGSDVEVPAADSSQLSFELAARVELPAEAKQELLQEASERIRVDRVGELLVDATVTVERQRRAAERAASNGKVDFS